MYKNEYEFNKIDIKNIRIMKFNVPNGKSHGQ